MKTYTNNYFWGQMLSDQVLFVAIITKHTGNMQYLCHDLPYSHRNITSNLMTLNVYTKKLQNVSANSYVQYMLIIEENINFIKIKLSLNSMLLFAWQ